MKVATVGSGSITNWFIDCWLECNNTLHAVYSRTYENGKKLADTYNCSNIYTNFDELLNDDNLDFIYIASPNSLHYEQAKKCLLANKNVILEKPFTSNTRETTELINLAKEKNLFLFEAITTCYLPNLKVLKEQLANIEPIHMVVSNMSQYSRKYNSYLANELPNVFNPKFSGGSLMDLNVYNIHFVTSILGYPNNVNYCATIKDGIDFGGTLTMQYPDAIATLVSCKNTHAQSNIQIQGEKGYIIVNSAASNVLNVNVYLPNQPVNTYNLQDEGFVHKYYIKDIEKIYNNKDYEACYKMLEHTLKVQNILDNARKSANIVFPSDNE